MAITHLDIRTFDVDDIKDCLENSGYSFDKHDFDFADEGAFKYNGFNSGTHKFLVGFKSDEDDDEFYVTKIIIGLSVNGGLCADYAGTVSFTGSYEGALEYIEKVCN